MITADYFSETEYRRYYDLCPKNIIPVLSLRAFSERRSRAHDEALGWRLATVLRIPKTFVIMAEQVHGNKVAPAGERNYVYGVDGVMTDAPEVMLTIRVADCLPIYLWDKKGKYIALLHAGWRGSVGNIAGEGVKSLSETYNVLPAQIGALLGPCVCQSCYQVGSEVADKFDPACVDTHSDGRHYLDIREANYRQLLGAGLEEESIFSDPSCTSCQPDIFFSYRRDGSDTGRMTAMIGINKA
ncbi:hypothetical protein CEE37_11215 [candidate division LCP-89 bacterium B3_LCP]|uniref:Purine nucleoside phosphorylase n=1 Tax=candidate division LCP-89 bacterium B3_LCP TaxID=2012998 RepID=A0A532UY55_UNCL8|nr:MAG: hypothetical protein CEE37_11215 [candidate division LCP-89 bacterium B3_LCP]